SPLRRSLIGRFASNAAHCMPLLKHIVLSATYGNKRRYSTPGNSQPHVRVELSQARCYRRPHKRERRLAILYVLSIQFAGAEGVSLNGTALLRHGAKERVRFGPGVPSCRFRNCAFVSCLSVSPAMAAMPSGSFRG